MASQSCSAIDRAGGTVRDTRSACRRTTYGWLTDCWRDSLLLRLRS